MGTATIKAFADGRSVSVQAVFDPVRLREDRVRPPESPERIARRRSSSGGSAVAPTESPGGHDPPG